MSYEPKSSSEHPIENYNFVCWFYSSSPFHGLLVHFSCAWRKPWTCLLRMKFLHSLCLLHCGSGYILEGGKGGERQSKGSIDQSGGTNAVFLDGIEQNFA